MTTSELKGWAADIMNKYDAAESNNELAMLMDEAADLLEEIINQ